MTARTLVAGLLGLLFFWGVGCTRLKPGECKRDNDCEKKVDGGLVVCFKGDDKVELGRCMGMKEAKETKERQERKMSGSCVDKDGDGVSAGDACDPPVDCDDKDPSIKPGATEICDNKDNNCNDGIINEWVKGCVGTVLGGKNDPVAQFMSTMTAGVRVAPNGDLWVADQHQIYKLDGKTLKAERVAGSNLPGNDDKKGKLARFDEPRGLAIGMDGTVYVSECNNNCIRKIALDGQVSTYAGLCSSAADDTGLDKEGSLTEARFWCPIDIAFDKDGGLLVADMRNSKIKRVSKDGQVKTIAGVGGKQDSQGYIVFGNSNGPALKAEFNEPASIAVGSGGEIVIADMKNNCIRQLKNGQVSTLAGVCASGSAKGGFADGPVGAAKFNQPNSVDVGPDGAVYVADTGNHCIRVIKDGKVGTFTGKCNQQGYFDGPLNEALFNGPQSLSVAKDGRMYVVDFGNYRVRQINP